MRISVSGMRAYLDCPRRAQYMYAYGIRERTASKPLREGLAFHEFLERWWLGEDLNEAMKAIPEELFHIRGWATAYDYRWKSARDDYEVIGVEPGFKAPKTKGFMDAAVIEKSTGRGYIIEHKTSGSSVEAGSPYWARLAIDPQVSIYWDAWQHAFPDRDPPFGVLYDVLKKPTIRQKQDETAEEYALRAATWIIEKDALVRRVIHRTEDEIDTCRWEVDHTVHQMARMNQIVPEVRNTDACVKGNHTCDFMDLCANRASVADYPQRKGR